MSGQRHPRQDHKHPPNLRISAVVQPNQASTNAPLKSEQILQSILYLDPDSSRNTAIQKDNRRMFRGIAVLVVVLYVAMFLWIRHWLR